MPATDRAAALTALMPRLMRRARHWARDPAEAEDLAQEALLRVWTRLSRDPPVEDVARYVMATLGNLARSRRPQSAELTDALMPVTAPDAPRRLAAAEVLAALSRLPPPQATLILDHAVGGISYADLARRHGLPVGTVMSRVARGRASLRAALGLGPDGRVAEFLGPGD